MFALRWGDGHHYPLVRGGLNLEYHWSFPSNEKICMPDNDSAVPFLGTEFGKPLLYAHEDTVMEN